MTYDSINKDCLNRTVVEDISEFTDSDAVNEVESSDEATV